MPKSLLINKESIIIPAISSVILFFVRKITGWELLYFPNLLFATWLFAAAALRLVNKITAKGIVDKSRADIAAAGIILIYGVTMSVMSVARHEAYSTSMYDLGNMDQAIWNSSQGNFLEVTSIGAPCLNVPRAINHLEWIYQIFALLYRAFPDVRVLLVVQTMFVCAGLAGLYFLAKATIQSPALCLITLGIAALFPSLQFANLFDFHGDLLAFPFLVWMVYFYNVRKNRMISAVMMFCALLCKEYVALVLSFYGALMIIQYKDWRWGCAIICVSMGYFIAALYWIMPSFNHGNPSEIISVIYTTKPGSGLYGLLSSIYEDPERYFSVIFSEHSFESLFYLLFPVFFFVWKSPVFLIPVIPVLAKDLLVGIDIGTHRIALVLPFLFASFVYTLKKMEAESLVGDNGKNVLHFNIILIVSAAVIASVAYGPSPTGHRFYREIGKYVKDANDFARDSVIAHIPDNAVISVSGLLAPHCTHRRFCYQFPRPFIEHCSGATPVDVIVLDTSDDESRMENHSGFSEQTIPWIVSLGYKQILEQSGVYFFRRSEEVGSVRGGAPVVRCDIWREERNTEYVSNVAAYFLTRKLAPALSSIMPKPYCIARLNSHTIASRNK